MSEEKNQVREHGKYGGPLTVELIDELCDDLMCASPLESPDIERLKELAKQGLAAEGMREDAERWRYLRDHELSPWAAVRAKGAKTPADIDAVVDEAIRATRQEPPK